MVPISALNALLTAVVCVLMIFASETMPVKFTTVRTRLGPVRGLYDIAANNQSYWSFLGIPYAKPPVGKLRFAKPEPLPYSDNVIDATHLGAACIQDSYFLLPTEKASEDCLFLNVFTKDLSKTSKKVLVWIHGGGFLLGSSTIYNPGSLVTSENIIVVTVNYRLGALGFLSTEDSSSPGNYGLWDQVMAIKWVKSNIAAFGGDPYDITIAGESAGGASVSLLSISPVTRRLFTKVYSHSGFATSLFAQYKGAKSDAVNLAATLNCSQNGASSKDLIECLRSKPASSFVTGLDLLRQPFVPSVDGDFLPRSPMKLVSDYKYLDEIGFYERDYFVVLNNNERTILDQSYYPAKDIAYSRSNVSKEVKDASWKQMVVTPNIARRLETENPNSKVVDFVLNFYENKFVGENGYPNLLTDVNFIVPAFDILNAASQNPFTRVWFLYFNHFPSYMRGTQRGMVHAMDVAYWFDVPIITLSNYLQAGANGDFSNVEMDVKRMYSGIVGDFVKSKLYSKGWPRYDSESGYYLEFNTNPVVMRHFDRDIISFWKNELPKKLPALLKCSPVKGF